MLNEIKELLTSYDKKAISNLEKIKTADTINKISKFANYRLQNLLRSKEGANYLWGITEVGEIPLLKDEENNAIDNMMCATKVETLDKYYKQYIIAHATRLILMKIKKMKESL